MTWSCQQYQHLAAYYEALCSKLEVESTKLQAVAHISTDGKSFDFVVVEYQL